MNNVLLVLNRRNDVDAIVRVLETMQYQSCVVEKETALEQYVSENPDVIIMDAELGVAMVGKIRRLFPMKAIIAVLPEHDARRAVELMRAGVFDCFDHPLNDQDIITVLKHVVLRYPSRRIDVLKSRFWNRFFTPRLLRWYAGGISGAAIIAALGFIVLRPSAVGVRFELPYDNPTAVVSAGDRVWVGNWYTQSIYAYQIKGKAVHLDGKTEFNGFGPVALALNEKYMWSFGNDFVLRQHVNDRGFDVINSYRIAEHAPAGMAFVGSDLWINDANSRKVYQYSLAKGVLVATIETGLAVPIGPAWDGRRLWFADAKTGKLTSFLPKPGRLESLATYVLPRETTGMLAGVSIDTGKIYLLFADNPSYILAFRERDLRRER